MHLRRLRIACCKHCFLHLFWFVVVPAKAASAGGRGREGQAAGGAEGRSWYRGQWLWGHGWNVWLPRYAINVSMYLPHPGREHGSASVRASLLFHVGFPVCLPTPSRRCADLFLLSLPLNFPSREATLQALQSLPCSGWGHFSRGRGVSPPLSCPCRPRNCCRAAQTNRGTDLTKLWASPQSAGEVWESATARVRTRSHVVAGLFKGAYIDSEVIIKWFPCRGWSVWFESGSMPLTQALVMTT